MSRKRKKKCLECVEFLSVDAPLRKVDYLEDKQSRYIHEYAKNKEYMIVGSVRRHGFSRCYLKKEWHKVVGLIRQKKLDGVILANMSTVAISMPEALAMIGEVIEAGGIVVTVDDGLLDFRIGGFEDGEEAEENV